MADEGPSSFRDSLRQAAPKREIEYLAPEEAGPLIPTPVARNTPPPSADTQLLDLADTTPLDLETLGLAYTRDYVEKHGATDGLSIRLGTQNYTLAHWPQRVIAYGIDYLLLSCLFVLLYFAVLYSLLPLLDVALIGLFLSVAYHSVLPARPGEHNGQTWGKEMMHIRFIRDNGKKAGVAFSFWYWIIFSFIMGFPIVGFINMFYPIFEAENRGFPDQIVGAHMISTYE